MNSVVKRISTVLALLACQAAVPGLVQAQQPRSLSDCRAIEGELARYACYEALEETAAAAGNAPAAAAPAAPAAVTPPRPVSNLPVVRRPATEIGDLTGQNSQQAPAAAAGGAAVRQQEEKPGLLRRLLPFGGDSDDDEAAPAATAEAALPAASSGDADVDSFGRRDRSAAAARVETNEDGKQELVDTVASIKTLTQNMLEVTLESGQVWRQMTTKRYPLQVGDSVVIRPTIWGKSYRLTAARISGFIQVQRVD